MLARIRIPGGLIATQQVRVLAEAAEQFADGSLDITARAGVQLRGIANESLQGLAEALAAAGLLPSPEHERVRNILANPFAGVDPQESIDVRPLVRELDARLIADARLAALPPRFAFALDGGGDFCASAKADLALRAVVTADGLRLHLLIGAEPAGYGVPPQAAVDALLAAAHAALTLAGSCNAPDHWRLADLSGARSAIGSALAPYRAACPSPSVPTNIAVPLGVLPAQRNHSANLVPTIPLGRLHASQARGIADISERFQTDVRLAWWRGIVFAAVDRSSVPGVREALARLGLVLDGSDGYAGIAACAGIDGCPAALADVRADARSLAQRLAGLPAAGDWSVNFAGCAKRCAMRTSVGVDLVATERGYDMLVGGTLVAADICAPQAIDAALGAHAARRAGALR